MNAIPVAVWSAAGAAVAGYWLAMRRFRKERAFERRAAWYERTAKLLAALTTDMHQARGYLAKQNGPGAQEAFRRAAQREPELIAAIGESELYAKQGAYDALAWYLEVSNELFALSGQQTPSSLNWELFIAVTEKMHEAARLAGMAIAREFRRDVFGWSGGRLDREHWRKPIPLWRRGLLSIRSKGSRSEP